MITCSSLRPNQRFCLKRLVTEQLLAFIGLHVMPILCHVPQGTCCVVPDDSPLYWSIQEKYTATMSLSGLKNSGELG